MKRFALGLLLLTLATPLRADGPVAPDGRTAVQIDVPLELRLRNSGGSDGPRGPGSGSGLCVSTSIEVAGRYQGEPRLVGLQEKMKHEPGGGHPAKVDRMLAKYAPGAPYLQVEDADPAFLRLCLESGYLVCTTVMGGAHMVNLVHLDGQWACLLDNNAPWGTGPGGAKLDNRLKWVRTPDYLRDADSFGRGIWAVVVLGKGPPPPIPTNAAAGAAWTPPEYTWRFDPRDPDRLYLWAAGGRMVGAYEPWHGQFWYVAGAGAEYSRWAAPPPLPPPALPADRTRARTVARFPDHGVTLGEPGARRKGFTLCGLTIDRAAAEQLVAKGAALPRLSVVGDDAFRAAVLRDLAGPLAWWAARLIVQDYPPDHPLAAGVKLQPGITLQPPPGPDGTGKVLFRLRAYPGKEGLAAALRKASPNYDPAKDPDPLAPAPPAPPPGPAPLAIGGADWRAYAPFGVLSALLAAALLLPGRQAPAAPTPNKELTAWIL